MSGSATLLPLTAVQKVRPVAVPQVIAGAGGVGGVDGVTAIDVHATQLLLLRICHNTKENNGYQSKPESAMMKPNTCTVHSPLAAVQDNVLGTFTVNVYVPTLGGVGPV